MKIRRPLQLPVDSHDVRYLLSYRACAELSTAVISQLWTHTILQFVINRISSSVIKVITRDTLWKATESAAIECALSLRYISAHYLAKGIKHHTFNTCSQPELYGLQLIKCELGKLLWFQCRLILRLWLHLSYLFSTLPLGPGVSQGSGVDVLGLSCELRTSKGLWIIKLALCWLSRTYTK